MLSIIVQDVFHLAEERTALVIPNKLRDAYSFEDIIRIQEDIYRKGVERLDLSRVAFVEPYSMLCLLLLGKNHLKNTGKRLQLVNIPPAIHQYLFRMDFFNPGIFKVTETLDEKALYKRSSFSNRVIEITDIPGKERECIRVISDVISLFRTRARFILKYWLSSAIIDYFVTVISEVCQNIFEHSLDSGYCAMQTYSIGSEHVVRLVIADSGIGIGESFAGQRDIRFDTTAGLIETVLTTPLSSKRRFGYGLCQVNAIIEKLGGSVFIRSGDGSVAVMYNRKHTGGQYSFLRNDLHAFPGTQISISLFA